MAERSNDSLPYKSLILGVDMCPSMNVIKMLNCTEYVLFYDSHRGHLSNIAPMAFYYNTDGFTFKCTVAYFQYFV